MLGSLSLLYSRVVMHVYYEIHFAFILEARLIRVVRASP